MNCCGNKRAAWQQENKIMSVATVVEKDAVPVVAPQSRTFEYTGASSRMIAGMSGKSYFFSFTGERLEVDHQDSFAMMAEHDIVLVPKDNTRVA